MNRLESACRVQPGRAAASVTDNDASGRRRRARGSARSARRRCGLFVAPCSRAGCPAASGPRRGRHRRARTPGKPDESHRLLRRYGLVAHTTVCCRDRPARLRALGTRGRRCLPPHCRRIAGFGEPRGRPVVAAFGQARPPWPPEESVSRACRRCACGGSPRVAPGRLSPRRRPPSPPGTLRVTCTCRVWSRAGAAYGCPGSGIGASCLWSG